MGVSETVFEIVPFDHFAFGFFHKRAAIRISRPDLQTRQGHNFKHSIIPYDRV